jgi:hypothetical protein
VVLNVENVLGSGNDLIQYIYCIYIYCVVCVCSHSTTTPLQQRQISILFHYISQKIICHHTTSCKFSITHNILFFDYSPNLMKRNRSIGRASSEPISSAPSKIYVQVNIQIFRILFIDDSTETVTLDMGISFMWDDPHVAARCQGVNFSSHPQISRLKKDISTIRNPQLWPDDYQPGIGAFGPAWKIDNSSDTRIIKKICMVLDPSIGRVHQYIHLVASIHHRLDMQNFPIDIQNFCFHMRSEHTMRVMEFIPYESREPKIFNYDTTEWLIIKPLTLSFTHGKPAANGMSDVFGLFPFPPPSSSHLMLSRLF